MATTLYGFSRRRLAEHQFPGWGRLLDLVVGWEPLPSGDLSVHTRADCPAYRGDLEVHGGLPFLADELTRWQSCGVCDRFHGRVWLQCDRAATALDREVLLDGLDAHLADGSPAARHRVLTTLASDWLSVLERVPDDTVDVRWWDALRVRLDARRAELRRAFQELLAEPGDDDGQEYLLFTDVSWLLQHDGTGARLQEMLVAYEWLAHDGAVWAIVKVPGRYLRTHQFMAAVSQGRHVYDLGAAVSPALEGDYVRTLTTLLLFSQIPSVAEAVSTARTIIGV